MRLSLPLETPANLFLAGPSKLVPITILVEMRLGVPAFNGILKRLDAPLFSF
jgi:hypothetical protein